MKPLRASTAGLLVLALLGIVGLVIVLWPAPPAPRSPRTAPPNAPRRVIRPPPLPRLGLEPTPPPLAPIPSSPGDATSPARAAAAACARSGVTGELSLDIDVDLPVLTGRHGATAWCHNGTLSVLEVLRGEDAWISWTPTDEGVEITVGEFDAEDALPTGYRTTRDGVEIERGHITRDAEGRETLTLERDGQRVKRYIGLQRAVSASSARAIDAWIATQGHPEDVAGNLRETLNMYDAEKIEETWSNGRMTRRTLSFTRDLGDGRMEQEMRQDLDGDGRIDMWMLSQSGLDGASRMSIVMDRDRDGQFEQWIRRVDPGASKTSAIAWPAETVTTERLRAGLL